MAISDMREADYKDLIGQKIDNYQIEELLAFHKVSVRYLSRTENDEPVFLEVLNDQLGEGSDWHSRFRKQMRLLTQLQHPNIAPLRHVSFTSSNLFYVAFQPVNGISLAQKFNDWRNSSFPSAQEALRLIYQLADALSSVQPAGILHYDLRPENIIIRNGIPVLINLGIPIRTSSSLQKQNTLDASEDMFLLDYVSPEEIYNEPLDERSNIYSLGIILYELLAGHRPNVPSSAWDIFNRASFPKEQPLEEAKPGLTRETYELTKMCLWRQQWDRFESHEQLIEAIDKALVAEEQKSITIETPLPKNKTWQFAVIIFLLLTFTVVGFVWPRRDSRLDEPTLVPITAVPANIMVSATNTVTIIPTTELIQTPQAVEGSILLLGPSPDDEFSDSDTIYFDWHWPIVLEPGQQFSVRLLADGKWLSVGTLDSPIVRSQYRLPVEVSTLNLASGNYLWYVALNTGSEENSLQSEQQSLSIRVNPPTATILPTEIPTQGNLSATQTRLASCTLSLPPGWIFYTVQPNDYLFNLALETNTTVARLQEVNCLDGPALGVGMILRLPSLPIPETPIFTPTSVISDTPPTSVSGSSNPTKPVEATKTPPPPPL